MELRITNLESRAAVVDAKMESIQSSLERIEGKMLTEWSVAKVVFMVVGALMTAAIFGPRIVEMMSQ